MANENFSIDNTRKKAVNNGYEYLRLNSIIIEGSTKTTNRDLPDKEAKKTEKTKKKEDLPK